MIGIFAASLLANCATAPFAAQHFGSFTTWGVLANMIAIPLTGFLIMPSVLLYVIALPLGLDGVIGPVFAFAILALVKIATMFAGLPFANSTLAPPGYVVLVLLVIAVVVSYVTTKPARFTGWGWVLWPYSSGSQNHRQTRCCSPTTVIRLWLLPVPMVMWSAIGAYLIF